MAEGSHQLGLVRNARHARHEMRAGQGSSELCELPRLRAGDV